MLRKRDSYGYDDSFKDVVTDKRQKLINGSNNGIHNGTSTSNGAADCTKEETLAARNKFIA